MCVLKDRYFETYCLNSSMSLQQIFRFKWKKIKLRFPGQPGRGVGPTTRGAPTSSVNQLDEATLDLLRLSQEPSESSQQRTVAYTSSKRASQPPDQLPKSASTSSMSRVVKTQVWKMYEENA